MHDSHSFPPTDAQRLRDEGNLALRTHFNAQLALLHDRTGLFALLSALLRLALLGRDDGDTRERLIIVVVLGRLLLGRHDDDGPREDSRRSTCCGNNDENRVELGVRSCGSPLLVCLSMR